MFEAGAMVGAGLLITFMKMNWTWRMHLLSNPLLVDILMLSILLLLHWGTFSGVMVATIGAATCSVALSGARFLCGYIEDGQYVPGFWNLEQKLIDCKNKSKSKSKTTSQSTKFAMA